MLMRCVQQVRDELRAELGDRYRDFTLTCADESCALLEAEIQAALSSSPAPHPPIEVACTAFVIAWLRERARSGGRLQLEYVLADGIVAAYADEDGDFVGALARRHPRGSLSEWRPKRKARAPASKPAPVAVASPAEVAEVLRTRAVSRETPAPEADEKGS